MLVPKVTVFLALSTVPGLFFFFFPEEPPPAALAPFLGGVRNDPGGGIDSSSGAAVEVSSAGEAGEAAPSTEDRLFFFFFFFFLSDDESGVAFCAKEGGCGGETGSAKGKGGERHFQTPATGSFVVGPTCDRSSPGAPCQTEINQGPAGSTDGALHICAWTPTSQDPEEPGRTPATRSNHYIAQKTKCPERDKGHY